MEMVEIRNRWTNACLWSGEIEDHGSDAKNLGAAALEALRSGASLALANLDGANLAWASLALANLDGANLDGANLALANLAGANLAGANLAGANLAGAYLDGAYLVGKRPILQIGPLGSRCAYLVSYITAAGIKVRAGCFFGTLEEFEAACAKTHGDNEHGKEYAAAVVMIRAHAALWMPEVTA